MRPRPSTPPTGSLLIALNAGSSSLKYAVYRVEAETDHTHQAGEAGDRQHPPPLTPCQQGQAPDMATLLARLQTEVADQCVWAIGHRVVHGGVSHVRPTPVSPGLMVDLRRLIPLAPLHQPHNLAGIEAAQAAFPHAHHVACFDTAFHRHHPWVADTFALPRRFYDEGVRRYGFHGLSYEYIGRHLHTHAPDLSQGRVIVAHLGNGASMCALHHGRSVASTMGFSALDGLPMGTRSGQIDPGVLLYLMTEHGMNASDLSDLLYKNCGLKGMSGLSNDMRELLAAEATHPGAAEALAYFVDRCRREIGGLVASLGGLDGIVFTGGIGEHAAPIRARILHNMGWLGVALDDAANDAHAPVISHANSAVQVRVVPTDEERMLAEHALEALTG